MLVIRLSTRPQQIILFTANHYGKVVLFIKSNDTTIVITNQLLFV